MMKNTILFLAFIVSSITLFAQDVDHKSKLGARVGFNFSTIAGDDFENPDARTSFYAGLVAETYLSDHLALQGEVFYSGQGFDIEETLLTPKAEFQIDYIQVPILAKIYLIKGFNIHVGPQLGFKVNEEIDTNPNDDDGDFDTDEINNFDFQVAAGAELKLTKNFFIQARYTYGLSEIVEDTDAHSSVLSAGVGFMF